ncbi:MAG TPA: Omp28-related outer membrane protein [Saprospiraceae bacterium]|nr:Omp28-related outer membrane protein [Saprospiraceae bacterium]HMQ81925.1 Omp28-related outer membrane protein [Saprospiraceae bacterium]
MRAFLLVASLLLVQNFAFAQAQRRVLIEHYTQASCGPCAAQNPAFNTLLFNNWDKVVPLKYQVWWPGYDPMYDQNPDDVDARVAYYGVTGVPNVRIDGTLDAGTSGSVTATQINNAYAVTTPLEMELIHSLSADLSTIYINCVVTNVSAETFDVANTVVRVAVMEQELIFPEPPGSTDEVDFYNVMRKMLPSPDGTPLTALAAGESFELNFEYALPDYIYRYDQLGAVAFVQTNGSRVVHQAAMSEALGAPAGFADLGLELASSGPESYCDYALIPGANLVNDSELEVTSFDLELLINGEVAATENWTGSLMPGMSTNVTFPEMAVEPGETEVEFNIAAVNGNVDYNRMNELVNTESFYTLSEEPFAEEIAESFEMTPNLTTPVHTIIESNDPLRMGVINAAVVGATGQVGAYAASSKSIMVDFYQWSGVGEQCHLVFDKIDLTNRADSRLRFDYAFANYPGFGPDRLTIAVSTDCGESWTQVFTGTNNEIATVAASTAYFVPTSAAQWDSISVDLSAYDGAEELNIRFTGQSGYGNNLFMDNIEVTGTIINAVDEPGLLANKVSTYPNPASDLVTVDFQLVENSAVNVSVYDAAGKLVATLANNSNMIAGDHRLTWAPALSGLYLIRVATENGAVTERVSVIR